jgi:enoyl-CoA hydratase/carnithine racemase
MKFYAANDAVTAAALLPHVALVTINRPLARNAVNGDVALGLEAAINAAESDPETWAVVLTGAGSQAFSAGADLKEVSLGKMNALYTARGGFAGFVHAPRTKPWIAAVNGFAVAGGFEIALACDMIVAAKDASLGLPEVKRGLIAAAGGLYRLPRTLPRQLANELIATGSAIGAQRCRELGLVNRVAAPSGAVAAACELAAEICANAPIAVRESLQVARQCFDLSDAQLRRRSETAQDRVMLTEDFQEGPRAFIEKRAPNWVGAEETL